MPRDPERVSRNALHEHGVAVHWFQYLDVVFIFTSITIAIISVALRSCTKTIVLESPTELSMKTREEILTIAVDIRYFNVFLWRNHTDCGWLECNFKSAAGSSSLSRFRETRDVGIQNVDARYRTSYSFFYDDYERRQFSEQRHIFN